MIVLNGEWSTFERGILENIVDVGARDLRFENIHFACDSITDAGGRVFIRERTCKFERIHSVMFPSMWCCSECGEATTGDEAGYFDWKYCPNCGSKVVEV